MKNTFGNYVHVTIFGESHGEAIGVVLDGLAAGIELDMDLIYAQIEKRKPKGKISTQRHEEDEIQFISGLFNGKTTGSPLCIQINNASQHSKDYEKTRYQMRPSHADYTAEIKYEGHQDYRGGGHFSGRITAPLVAAGAIASQVLKAKGIEIASHILRCKDVEDIAFSDDSEELSNQMNAMNQQDYAVIDEKAQKLMLKTMEDAAAQGDSVGGILETMILGVPAGIGEPFFDSVESTLSHLLFSVPAVKGVEFGLGFDFAKYYGSEVNDAMYYNQGVKTKTNHNAGINGGITNGMPIRIKTCVKPTPSIYKPQETIDLRTNEAITLQINGRHDPAIIHRARVVVDSVVALGILDLICTEEARKGMK